MGRPKKRPAGPHIYRRRGRRRTPSTGKAPERMPSSAPTPTSVESGLPLAEPGSTWGTTDPDIALVLFETELDRLRAKRRGRVGALTQQQPTLAKLVRHHLVMRNVREASPTPTSSTSRLGSVSRSTSFGRHRDPSSIVPETCERGARSSRGRGLASLARSATT